MNENSDQNNSHIKFENKFKNTPDLTQTTLPIVKSIVRSKSAPKNSYQVKPKKTVTFADEVGLNLTQSIYYKQEYFSLDDSVLSDRSEEIEILCQSSELNSFFNTFNFDRCRNNDTLINTNKYGIYNNHIALKSLFIRCSSINILIIVRNVAFDKLINIHYTTDDWNSKQIEVANFFYSQNDEFDIFNSKISLDPAFLSSIQKKCFEFAIEYKVNDRLV